MLAATRSSLAGAAAGSNRWPTNACRPRSGSRVHAPVQARFGGGGERQTVCVCGREAESSVWQLLVGGRCVLGLLWPGGPRVAGSSCRREGDSSSSLTPPRPPPSPPCNAPPALIYAGVMDRPADAGVDLAKRSGWDGDRDSNIATLPRPDTGSGDGGTDQQKKSPPGGGRHRLLLLDSPKHTEPHVVKCLTTIVNVDPQHAQNCHATAKQLGMALVTSCLKEHAEFYMQQLFRHGVRTAIEPDSTVA